MRLGELLAGVDGAVVVGERAAGAGAIEVSDVRDDSRQVAPGDMFVAVAGTAADGRAFLDDAVRRGARVLVVDAAAAAGAAIPPGFSGAMVTVPASRPALAAIAANRFPAARALTLSAVTGTNGKTTTTYLVEAMLAAAGISAGVIGTVAYRVAAPAGFSRTAPLTTPGALALSALLADMQAAGATDVVLEASSHALEQSRLDGCDFRVAALTNVTQDHLDYHGTMERYFDAKAILFERRLDARAGVAVLPMDKPEGRAMAARARAAGRVVLGVAATPGTLAADVRVESMRASADGLRGRLATPAGAVEVASPLVGDYNLENIVLAAGMGIARGLPPEAIAAGIARLAGVAGRLERVANDRGVLCVVDYAHTPDALVRAMAALRPLVAPGARLIAVFGCGGDRDRTKRPLMGAAVARDADLAIVTSDNPRTEEPAAILAMIVEGVKREAAPPVAAGALAGARRGYTVLADRRAAIRAAAAAARAGDVLLIAGKGHEDYQIVGTQKLHFDDREEAAAALAPTQGQVQA